MCGIIGYSAETPQDLHYDAIASLFVQSKIRGLHAFGFSYFNGETLVTVKEHKLEDLLRSLFALKTFKPKQLIGHTRYSTSGDYLNHGNNQPIVADGIALVFNGVIDMRSRSSWEQEYNTKFVTDNDGEIILRHIQQGGCPVEFLKSKRCSFAGLYFYQGRMCAVRNANRPMWQAEYEGATLIASTKDIFRRSLNLDPKQVPPLSSVALDATNLAAA